MGCSEGSRSNLFLVVGDELMTISTEASIVPGIMRQLVLDVAEELPIESEGGPGTRSPAGSRAGEVFLTNAVRGIIPVARSLTGIRSDDRAAGAGPWTERLQELLARRLWPDRGGTTP